MWTLNGPWRDIQSRLLETPWQQSDQKSLWDNFTEVEIYRSLKGLPCYHGNHVMTTVKLLGHLQFDCIIRCTSFIIFFGASQPRQQWKLPSLISLLTFVVFSWSRIYVVMETFVILSRLCTFEKLGNWCTGKRTVWSRPNQIVRIIYKGEIPRPRSRSQKDAMIIDCIDHNQLIISLIVMKKNWINARPGVMRWTTLKGSQTTDQSDQWSAPSQIEIVWWV